MNKQKIFVVFGSILVCLILVELAFRIYGYVQNIDFRLYALELKNSNRLPKELFKNGLNPNTKVLATTSDFSTIYSINSHGFRDQEYLTDKPENTIRIAFFGDSFTFGEGVSYGKRISEIVERNLQVEVLNFGLPGAGLDGILYSILYKGIQFHPDYVVILLNRYTMKRGNITEFLPVASESGNTLPASGMYRNTTDTNYLSRSDEFYEYNPGFLQKNSYLISYLYYLHTSATLIKKMRDQDEKFWSDFAQCDEKPTCGDLTQLNVTQRNHDVFNKILEITRSLNIRFIGINIDTEPLEYFYSSPPPFEYFDLHEDLREYGKKHKLSFIYDHHYNEKTNLFLGEKISNILDKIMK